MDTNNFISSENNHIFSVLALLKILADGNRHSFDELCQALKINTNELEEIFFRLPENIKSDIICQENSYLATRPVAIFKPEDFVQNSDNNNLISVVDSCASTNALLMSQIKNTSNAISPYAIIANHQSNGVGRQGKKWIANIGNSITFSLVVSTSTKLDCSALPLVVALSCQEVLKRFNLDTQIKWPNDLVMGQAKLGGILVESTHIKDEKAFVIGVGLNLKSLNIEEYDTAGILDYIGNINLAMLVQELIEKIIYNANNFFAYGFSSFHLRYMLSCRDQNKTVSLIHQNGEIKQGIMIGVDKEGALLLDYNGYIEHIFSAEVSLRPSENQLQHTVEQLLFLDCGNSQAKWAWVANSEILATFHVPYTHLSLLSKFSRNCANISQAYGSAVCDKKNVKRVSQSVSVPVKWFYSEKTACGIYNHYLNIKEHGSDRWFNAIGARHFTSSGCLIVSCGTAVTIDALTTDNHYLGGNILPGFKLMRQSLALNTANLNRPIGRVYPFSTNTSNAIVSGIIMAIVGAIKLTYEQLQQREQTESVDVILTGGNANIVFKHLSDKLNTQNQIKIVDNLVIWGLMKRVELL